MQCIIMENTLIELTLHDETKKRAHDSQIVRAKENLKSEHFMNLGLLPYQKIEDYYSNIMDRGRQIHKTAPDILLKFIASGSGFFVWAANPEDIQAALTASKLEEANGYKASLPST